MRASIFSVLIVSALTWIATLAAEEMPYDHVHLNSTDPDEAVAWYAKHMDGVASNHQKGRLRFGTTQFIFFKREAGFAGSAGSVIDHIGFSFRDLDAKMNSFRDSGIKILAEPKDVAGKFKYGFIEDPWGTKIEVMEDHETLGFHHIHLSGPDPIVILDWYQNAFGGERTRYKGLLDALNYQGVWLLAMRSRQPVVPSDGRAIDHLGWGVRDMDAEAKALKKKGVPFTMEPRPFNPKIAIAIAFVEGPGGVKIELVQRP